MTQESISLDEILYRNAAPWHPENSIEEKFPSLIRELKEVEPAYPFKFNIEFERPISNKTKYYNKRIINEAIETVNQFHQIISNDDNPQIRAFWMNKVLEKKLQTKLKDIGQLIREKDYSLSYIDPKKASFDQDQDHKSNTYVMQLLKTAYIFIYLEIQEAFKQSVNDFLIIEDCFTQLLKEPIPDKTYITENTVIEIVNTQPRSTTTELRSTSSYSFTYKQYDTNPDNLKDLHDSLKKNNFISSETSLPAFKRIFSGKEVTTPIVWTGNLSELYYFIKLIHNDKKYVEDLKQKQWEVTCSCFVQENEIPFDRSKFRSQKRPSLTGDILDTIVELLK
jgi:hypothetical protein